MRNPFFASVCLAGFLFFLVGFHFDFARLALVSGDDAGRDTEEPQKHSKLRRVIYRVNTATPPSEATNLSGNSYNSVPTEDLKYWTRVLQQSTDPTDNTDPTDSPETPAQQPGRTINWRYSASWSSRPRTIFSRRPTLSWNSRDRGVSSRTQDGQSWISRYIQNYGSQMSWNGSRNSVSRRDGNNWSRNSVSRRDGNNRSPNTPYRYVNVGRYKTTQSYGGNRYWQGYRHLAATNTESISDSRRRNSENPVKLIETRPTFSKNLDIFVAGFPKCGTTSLLYAFKDHEETAVGDREKCDIANPNYSDTIANSKLDQTLSELTGSDDSSVKTVIKCPSGIRRFHAIDRLSRHSPDARIVIGVRHPVKFFQSFYNYRITEVHTKGKKDESIPSVAELVGSAEWRGVSTDNARFELFLMQLGKTEVSDFELQELSNRGNMAVTLSSSKVFLYSLEQLEDRDTKREESFRQEMQHFLQLKQPLEPFDRENMNHFVGEQAFPETIDICNAEYDHIRGLLVFQGMKTQEWIRSQFLSNPDVFVGNEDHFLQILDTWGTDPCIRDASEYPMEQRTPEVS